VVWEGRSREAPPYPDLRNSRKTDSLPAVKSVEFLVRLGPPEAAFALLRNESSPATIARTRERETFAVKTRVIQQSRASFEFPQHERHHSPHVQIRVPIAMESSRPFPSQIDCRHHETYSEVANARVFAERPGALWSTERDWNAEVLARTIVLLLFDKARLVALRE
jgi:hypothetical protein